MDKWPAQEYCELIIRDTGELNGKEETMFCENCGRELKDGLRFCTYCGAKISEKPEAAIAPGNAEPVSVKKGHANNIALPEGMTKNEDGAIVWNCDLDMKKFPYVLFAFYKMFLYSCGGFGLLIAMAFGSASDDFGEAMAVFLIIFLGIGGGLCVIATIVYFLVLAVGGSIYETAYLMGDDKIEFYLLGSKSDELSQKKAQALLWAVDQASGGVSSAGLNFELVGHKVSEYKKVKKITVDKGRNLIKLKTTFIENRIFAQPQQYQFVADYLTSHCQGARVIS